MPRIATPYLWREWYVTKAGTNGTPHKLCHKDEGVEKAEEELKKWQEKCRRQKAEAREQGLVEADTPYQVSHLAAEFLQLKEATKRTSTFEFYLKSLQRFVDWYGHLEARKMSLTHATDFVSRLRNSGLSNVTINHEIRAAKAVLNYGVDTERLAKNPWRKAANLPEWGRKRVVTDEEFEKLQKACDECISYRGRIRGEENAQLMKDILKVLRFTAMRPGELRHLRWEHLHLDGNAAFIIIPANEQKTGTTSRTPQDRIIPVLDEAKEIMRRRKEKHGTNPLVFPNIMGKEWTDHLFSQRFARLRKRAGLDGADRNGEKIVPYSLRHTRLTEAATTEDWPFPHLMQLAGHTTAQMTNRYVHPNKEDLHRAMREGHKRRLALAEEE